MKNIFKNYYKMDQQKLEQHAADIQKRLIYNEQKKISILGALGMVDPNLGAHACFHEVLQSFEGKNDYDGMNKYLNDGKPLAVQNKNPYASEILTTVLKERSILHYEDDELSSMYNELYNEYHNFILEHCKNGTFDSEYKAVYDEIVSKLDKYDDIYS